MKTMLKSDAISLLALVISNIARSGSDEVELKVEWDIANTKPKPVFDYYELPYTLLDEGNLTFFDYRSADGRVRTRIGELLEINYRNDSLLIWDFHKDAPRRSNFEGIGKVYILEASS